MDKTRSYQIIKRVHQTEKASMLAGLCETKEGKPNLCACECPKAVFLVDKNANKKEIAQAVESIYSEKNVRVKKVNTILMKPKSKRRRGKGRDGTKAGFKKAIVTLEPGDSIVDQ